MKSERKNRTNNNRASIKGASINGAGINRERINRIIGGIDEDLIEQADTEPEIRHVKKYVENTWFKWSAVAVTFAAILVMGIFLSGIINKEVPYGDIEKYTINYPERVTETIQETIGETDGKMISETGGEMVSEADGETLPATQPATFSERYVYSVDEGVYAAYVGGRVIDASRIGNKLEKVAVTGGWMNYAGTMLTEEHADAEVFEIEEISTDIAVAIRFLGKLEAMTTEHYYVIYNPESDLTAIQEYVIDYFYPANGEE